MAMKRISGQVWEGFVMLGVINGVAALACLAVPDALIFFPLLHLAWGIPWIVKTRRAGHGDYAKGLTIAASLTLLLSSACWVIVGNGFHGG